MPLSPSTTYTSIDQVLKEVSWETYGKACRAIDWCHDCRKLQFYDGCPKPDSRVAFGWSELCIHCTMKLVGLCLTYEGGKFSFPVSPELEEQQDTELMEYLDGIRS